MEALVAFAPGKISDETLQRIGRIVAQFDLAVNIPEPKVNTSQYLRVGEEMIQEFPPVRNLPMLEDQFQCNVFMEKTLSCPKEV